MPSILSSSQTILASSAPIAESALEWGGGVPKASYAFACAAPWLTSGTILPKLEPSGPKQEHLVC